MNHVKLQGCSRKFRPSWKDGSSECWGVGCLDIGEESRDGKNMRAFRHGKSERLPLILLGCMIRFHQAENFPDMRVDAALKR